MKPYLYVIEGHENDGKTTTCWLLLNMLKPYIECINYWKLSFDDNIRYDTLRQMYVCPQKIASHEGGTNNPIDFIFVARINNPAHCKIAIISAGDEALYVKKHIYEMLGNDVHHIVCCERTYNKVGSTKRMLHYEFNISSFVYEQTLTHPCNSASQIKVATDIFNLLTKIK